MSNEATELKTEAKIQQEIALWYRNTFCLKHHKPRCMIFSIPNEGRGAASAQLMATGLYPGCADLDVRHRSVHCERCLEKDIISKTDFFAEVKTPDNRSGPKGTGQSKKQIDFEQHCKQMGIAYHIVRSLEDFKAVINSL